jgi:hypothetical protein
MRDFLLRAMQLAFREGYVTRYREEMSELARLNVEGEWLRSIFYTGALGSLALCIAVPLYIMWPEETAYYDELSRS